MISDGDLYKEDLTLATSELFVFDAYIRKNKEYCGKNACADEGEQKCSIVDSSGYRSDDI